MLFLLVGSDSEAQQAGGGGGRTGGGAAGQILLINSARVPRRGSAIANSLSEIVACLLLFSYIRWRNLHGQTWGGDGHTPGTIPESGRLRGAQNLTLLLSTPPGWSTECLQEWGSHMKLAIPSALIVCFEWWIWEIGGILAGECCFYCTQNSHVSCRETQNVVNGAIYQASWNDLLCGCCSWL